MAFVKKSYPATESGLGSEEKLDVTVEPLAGYSDDEIVTLLQKAGASGVTILAPGFISARAAGSVLRAITHAAQVHRKPLQQPHAGLRVRR
jgi:hypothetical protein